MIIGENSISTQTASSAADCCDLCSKTYGCQAYTWATDGSNSCFLKDNVNGNESNPERISGVNIGPPAPPPPPPTPVPIPRSCVAPYDKLPFCNTSLPLDQRINSLIGLLKLVPDEIPQILTARASPKGAVPRIGLAAYDWGMNAVHGVQSRCGYLKLENGTTILNCPTSFPCPNALGAAWNMSIVNDLGRVIATEARSLWLQGVGENHGNDLPHIGLDAWSPNINNGGRDPRWGRNQETNGESPQLLGDYGKSYTEGLQLGEDERFVKTVVTLKHFNSYELEDFGNYTRHTFNAVVNPFMFGSTYLVPFEAAVTNPKAPAAGVMCSYNAVNGVPACANNFLRTVLREEWNFSGYVTSDSGAVHDIYANHHYVSTPEEAVKVALEGGETDINSGGVYSGSLISAYNQSLITMKDIQRALYNSFWIRFRLGLFDPIDDQPYWHVPPSAVNSPEHQALNLHATLQSMTLLKNDGNTLPLAPGKTVAVIGPHAQSRKDLTGNYLGELCPSGGSNCIPTPTEMINATNVGGTTLYAQGCAINSQDKSGFDDAVAAAKQADYVVMLMGIDQSIEGEGHDRTSVDLPGVQHDLIATVAAVGKPTTVVLVNGGMVAVEPEKQNSAVGAILETFYPGTRGAEAMAKVLFGQYNPGGKLPVTVYQASIVDDFDFYEMDISKVPGRGYRFYTGDKVTYAFGHGLSYTSFKLSWSQSSPASLPTGKAGGPTATFSVVIENTGAVAGDDVVQCYFYPQSDVKANEPLAGQVPLIKDLCGYQRVHLEAGESTTVTFTLDATTPRITDRNNGNILSAPGTFNIVVNDDGVSTDLSTTLTLTGSAVVIDDTVSKAWAKTGGR